jgi:hypothetical protein
MDEPMTASRLDALIERTDGYQDTSHAETRAFIAKMYDMLFTLKPSSNDACRELWLCVPTENAVNSNGHPADMKWYKLKAYSSENVQTVYIGKSLVFVICESSHNTPQDHSELAAWLLGAVETAIATVNAGTYHPPKWPQSRFRSPLYMESKVKWVKRELIIERDPDGYLYADGRYRTKILPDDLPDWYVYGYLYKQHGYLCAKGVKQLIYKPNYFITNHSFKYDTLYISYDKEIIPCEDERGSIWYKDYDHAIGGPMLPSFVNAVGYFSDYDVSEIQQEVVRKKAFYYEHNPERRPGGKGGA